MPAGPLRKRLAYTRSRYVQQEGRSAMAEGDVDYETEVEGNSEVLGDDEIEIIDDQGRGEDAELPFYTITSYGADYPIDGLVKRIADGSIFVPTFQRGYVWGLNQASRFIESLLLGLPVPGIFLSKEKDTQKLLVIDGQQRLRTLQYFYEGIFAPTDKGFSLKKVHSTFANATYKSLSEELRRRLDDSILHATIVHQETPTDDDSSVYQIFERLNTGGVRLSPQEIRTCIYHGPLADILRELNDVPTWRESYGPVSRRMRDQEMILRFLALRFTERYEEYMVEFLNKYMGSNRKLTVQSAEDVTTAFVPTINAIHEALGRTAFRPKGPFNAAVFDAVMVGVSRRLAAGPIENAAALADRYRTLLEDAEFVNVTETGTAHQENVQSRLALATEAFASAE